MKKILFLFLAFYTIANVYSQTSDEFYKSGTKKLDLKDYQGAIIDFSKLNCKLKVHDNLSKNEIAAIFKSNIIALDRHFPRTMKIYKHLKNRTYEQFKKQSTVNRKLR